MPTIDEQIAAVEECINIAQGVIDKAIGGAPALEPLRGTYQQRIARLEAAITTLKGARPGE